jgi:hypothetical protein
MQIPDITRPLISSLGISAAPAAQSAPDLADNLRYDLARYWCVLSRCVVDIRFNSRAAHMGNGNEFLIQIACVRAMNIIVSVYLCRESWNVNGER